jgi:sodium-dependent dicarboxylate transporter 2/3/5
MFQKLALPLSPAIGILAGYIAYTQGLEPIAAKTLAISVWTALWWISEAVPIPVASIVPLALFPALGILDDKEVAKSVGNKLVLLLMGGFLISKGMEKSNVHRRLALMMVNACGGSGKGLVLGFMFAAASLSMWISNTATALMLLPIALAILDNSSGKGLTIPLLLGIAYAANIGGLGTPIGTPPNLVFIDQYKGFTDKEYTFFEWMKHGVPVLACMLPLMWLWLTRGIKGAAQLDLPKVGEWREEERRTLMVFGFTALAWATRDIWSKALDIKGTNDACVAFASVILMFCIPNGEKDGGKLLDWETAVTIPWGILLLFGGGISIATAFKSSGLSQDIAGLLAGLDQIHPYLIILAICLVVTFLTEMTSNTATSILLMPILGTAAKAANLDPALLMMPAVMSASCAFMLPVATAPNAVVFASGRIHTTQMMKEGLALNFIGAAVISILCYFMLR